MEESDVWSGTLIGKCLFCNGTGVAIVCEPTVDALPIVCHARQEGNWVIHDLQPDGADEGRDSTTIHFFFLR